MIDTTKFEFAESRWQDIFNHLDSAGFDVYPPGVKLGDCKSEYVVIRNDGSVKNNNASTDDDMYAVMCYVPKMGYSKLEPLVQRIKAAMKGLEPMIVPYGSQTPSYYDDSVKAHMVSIEYKNHKKML